MLNSPSAHQASCKNEHGTPKVLEEQQLLRHRHRKWLKRIATYAELCTSLRLDTSVSSSILGLMADPIETIDPSSLKTELKATLLLRLGEQIMSHITFKMCQFVLIIYLRDYHYDFYLDIYVLWSFYGVLRLTYTTFQNLCPTDHFFGRLLMSQDISPNWMVLLEFTYRIIQKFFRIFPMSKIVL